MRVAMPGGNGRQLLAQSPSSSGERAAVGGGLDPTVVFRPPGPTAEFGVLIDLGAAHRVEKALDDSAFSTLGVENPIRCLLQSLCVEPAELQQGKRS